MLRLALLAALLFAPHARAQGRIPHPVQLEYIRGQGTQAACPPESALHHVITSRMKQDPFVPAARSKARVAILRVESAFQASYELLNDAEQWVGGFTFPRRDDCINALEDVGISMSHHMPLLLSDSTPPPPAPVEEPATTSAPAKAAVPPRAPPRQDGGGGGGGREPLAKQGHPIVGRLHFGALVSKGTTPATAFGFRLDGGGHWWFLSFSAGLRVDISLPSGTDTIQIDSWRALGEAAPCLRLDLDKLSLFGCGVVQFGQLTATFQTPDFSRTLSATNVEAGGRLFVQLPHPSFFLDGWDPFVSVDLMGAVQYADIFLHHRFDYAWFAPYLKPTLALGVAYSHRAQ